LPKECTLQLSIAKSHKETQHYIMK
jgi:hypothetical protein